MPGQQLVLVSGSYSSAKHTFYIIWFAIVALIGLLVLSRIALWYQSHLNLKLLKSGDRFAQSISKNDCNIGSDFNDFDIFEVLLYGSMSSYFTLFD
jgi:FSR family fosmidomycin resistance protein-like MFS transporter